MVVAPHVDDIYIGVCTCIEMHDFYKGFSCAIFEIQIQIKWLKAQITSLLTSE